MDHAHPATFPALLGAVEVLPGLRDGPLGVGDELIVLVSRDDPPGFQGFDLVDRLSDLVGRLSSRPEAADDHASPEANIAPFVDHIPGGDQPEFPDVEDAVEELRLPTRSRRITWIKDDRSCPE